MRSTHVSSAIGYGKRIISWILSLSVNIGYRLSRTWVVDRAPRRFCLVRWWDWGTHDSEGITSGSCVSTTSDSPPHHLLSVSPPLLHLTTSAQRWRDHRCAWFKLNAVVLQRWNGRPGNVSVVSVDIHDKKVKFRGWYYRNPSRWPRKPSNFCFFSVFFKEALPLSLLSEFIV